MRHEFRTNLPSSILINRKQFRQTVYYNYFIFNRIRWQFFLIFKRKETLQNAWRHHRWFLWTHAEIVMRTKIDRNELILLIESFYIFTLQNNTISHPTRSVVCFRVFFLFCIHENVEIKKRVKNFPCITSKGMIITALP